MKRAVDRQREMYEELARHPFDEMTLKELAAKLDRRRDSSFNADLSAVRHLALDDGNEVTNCVCVGANRWVLYFLPAGQSDRGLSTLPLMTRSAFTRTSERNTSRHGTWTERNGASATDRAIGGLIAEVSKQTQGVYDKIQKLQEIIQGKD